MLYLVKATTTEEQFVGDEAMTTNGSAVSTNSHNM